MAEYYTIPLVGTFEDQEDGDQYTLPIIGTITEETAAAPGGAWNGYDILYRTLLAGEDP